MINIICGIIITIITYFYLQYKNNKDKKNNIRKSLLLGLISWFVCGKFLSLEKKNIFNFDYSNVKKHCYLDDLKILIDKPDF